MKKILIVDDQDFIRTVFKKHFEVLEDVTIIEATNGNEAIGKAKAGSPDLILLDIVMPQKDGLEVLKELQENEATVRIPVIVVSSHADEEKIALAKRLGAREFIDKVQLNDIDFVALVKRYLDIA